MQVGNLPLCPNLLAPESYLIFGNVPLSFSKLLQCGKCCTWWSESVYSRGESFVNYFLYLGLAVF